MLMYLYLNDDVHEYMHSELLYIYLGKNYKKKAAFLSGMH